MTTPDRYAWAVETARRLRNGESVDNIAIAEEIEQMSRSDARELNTRVGQILEHLLKLRLVRGVALDYNKRGWELSILRQRNEIEEMLEESPSLKGLITKEAIAKRYRGAAAIVANEYDVEPPSKCPFSVGDIMDTLAIDMPKHPKKKAGNRAAK